MKLMDYLHWNDVNEDNLNFYQAMGLDCLLVHFPVEIALHTDPASEFIRMKRYVATHGLDLHVLHAHYIPRDKIVHGLPGRDEQIEVWYNVLRAMGKAGVPNTALTFQGIGHFRTPHTTGRGGVTYSTFDYAEYKKNPRSHPDLAISADRLWENLAYFYERIIPVAEEAGVRIALHPDDPPIDVPLGGADGAQQKCRRKLYSGIGITNLQETGMDGRPWHERRSEIGMGRGYQFPNAVHTKFRTQLPPPFLFARRPARPPGGATQPSRSVRRRPRGVSADRSGV